MRLKTVAPEFLIPNQMLTHRATPKIETLQTIDLTIFGASIIVGPRGLEPRTL